MNETASTASTPARLEALDAFRGATILAMILVNNPGSWSHVYPPLRHADWHGWTPTDLVFPFFLFIVGVAIPLSLGRRLEAGVERGQVVRQVLRRALVLVGLGLFLNAFPFVVDFETWLLRSFETLRFPGVLQRIAVCYALAALLFVFVGRRVLVLTAWVCLFSYWALLTLVPLPGGVEADLAVKDQNLAAVIDRAVFGTHVWASARTWDPEGLLSTVPALATTLFGVFTGLLLRTREALLDKVLRLFVRGSLLVGAGYVWDWFFPINKPLWTSSYVVFTAGQAMVVLALALYLVDVRGRRVGLRPLLAYGVNPITVFVLSAVVARLLTTIRVTSSSGNRIALKTWLYEGGYTSWIPDPQLASFAFAVTWVLAWYALLAWMQRRNIIIKV